MSAHPAQLNPIRIAKMANQVDKNPHPIYSAIIRCLTPEVANSIIAIQLDETLQERCDAWARQANEGLLSEADRKEYAQIIDQVDMLGMFKSLARQSLRKELS